MRYFPTMKNTAKLNPMIHVNPRTNLKKVRSNGFTMH
jgi:hypothetical protein